VHVDIVFGVIFRSAQMTVVISSARPSRPAETGRSDKNPKEAGMISKRLVALALTVTLSAVFAPVCKANEAMPAADESADGGSWAAAGVSDVIFIPSKATTCAMSGVLWLAVMSLTGGTKYKMAGNFVHDACTGKWVIKGEDMVKNEKEDWFLED